MRPIPGARPPDPKDLVRVRDRLTFLYVERCTINRDSNAITVADGHGIAHVPAAALSVLLLGPGVRITHSAVSVLSESGSTIVWVGENGVRYYAHGSARSIAKLADDTNRTITAQFGPSHSSIPVLVKQATTTLKAYRSVFLGKCGCHPRKH